MTWKEDLGGRVLTGKHPQSNSKCQTLKENSTGISRRGMSEEGKEARKKVRGLVHITSIKGLL